MNNEQLFALTPKLTFALTSHHTAALEVFDEHSAQSVD